MSTSPSPQRPEGATSRFKFRNPAHALTMSARPASPATTTGRNTPTRSNTRDPPAPPPTTRSRSSILPSALQRRVSSALAPSSTRTSSPKGGSRALSSEAVNELGTKTTEQAPTEAPKEDTSADLSGHARALSGSTVETEPPMTPPLTQTEEPISNPKSDENISDSPDDGASTASSRSPSRLRRQVSNLSRRSASGSIRRLSLLGPPSPPQVETVPIHAQGEMQHFLSRSPSLSSLRRHAASPESPTWVEPETPVKPPMSRSANRASLTRSPTPDRPEPKRRGTLASWARKSLDRRSSISGSPAPSTSAISRSASRRPVDDESDSESVGERERKWGTGLPVPEPPTPKKSEDNLKRRFSLGRRARPSITPKTSSVDLAPEPSPRPSLPPILPNPDSNSVISSRLPPLIIDLPTALPEKESSSPPAPNDTIQESKITTEMPLSDVLLQLSLHGCKDITQDLDKSKCSEYPEWNGGFGEVYQGVLQNGTKVSIKILKIKNSNGKKKLLKHTARELYVWSKCKHPNILSLIGMAQFRNQITMVSPWMENGNLQNVLLEHPELNRCEMCLQIADSISYLHSEGIVHGDIKGANILVSHDYTPKLADFGNAAWLGENTPGLRFATTTSNVSMSLRWAPPEIVLGTVRMSFNADVYSLGMTILEVMTRLPPYESLGEYAVVAKIMTKTHPERPESCIPSGVEQADRLWSLLTNSWNPNPDDRPSASEVRDEMKSITPEGLKRNLGS